MQSLERFSRRAVLERLFSSLLLAPFFTKKILAASERSIGMHSEAAVRRYCRPLRVHASILVFGMTIYRRDDVGSGCATVEIGSTGGQKITALQFAAGSTPQRARGLNRLGLMREVVVEEDARVSKSSYSGFMTASPEKSLDQGRHALDSSGKEIPCTLASGESIAGETGTTIRHFAMPVSTQWTDAPRLMSGVANADEPRESSERSSFGPSATFLYAIRRAAMDPAQKSRREFCHDGKLHQLITKKQGTSMSGSIVEMGGAKISDFEVWLDAGDPSGIPNRIEFRARSFLRLTFEAGAVVEQQQSALPWLLD